VKDQQFKGRKLSSLILMEQLVALKLVILDDNWYATESQKGKP